MAKVTLISYTGHGNPDPLYAARLLAFTKNTRLKMSPEGFEAMNEWSEERLMKELAYMAKTIPSSWEFVDLIFMIEGMSRNQQLQLVRTRQASYAMQSQRVTDMRKAGIVVPEGASQNLEVTYGSAQSWSLRNYARLIDEGETEEDARGILLGNIESNGVAKYNMRTWTDLMQSRSSLRAQGEYRHIASQMKSEVLKVMPWVTYFLQPKHEQAITIIEEIAEQLPLDQRRSLAKAADLLKKA